MKGILMFLIMTSAVLLGGDYRLTVDSRVGVRMDGSVRVGRFIQSKDGVILVARMRKPRKDEHKFIREELREIPYDTAVLEAVSGYTLYIVWRHAVMTCIGDGEYQRTLSSEDSMKYVETHGGEWCRRGDVYGVAESRIKFCGWCSYRTAGWDGKAGPDAVWDEFKSSKQGWPLPAGFDDGMKQKETMEKQQGEDNGGTEDQR